MPSPTMTSQARWTTFVSEIVGRSADRDAVQPLDDGRRAGARIGQPGREPRDRDPAGDRAVRGSACPAGSRVRRKPSSAPARSRRTSPAGCCTPTGPGASPTPIWIGVMIAATVNAMVNPIRWYRSVAAAQHPGRVHRRDQEPADQVRRDHHVRGLQRHRVVEDHLERLDLGDLAVRVHREAGRRVHPRVRGDDRDRSRRRPRSRSVRRSRSASTVSAGASRRCRSRRRSPR